MPKNPTLYRLLSRKFQVRVSNRGQSYVGSIRRLSEDRFFRNTIKSGEYYCICCPYCNDTRFRLWINYRWDWNLFYRDTARLAICYNTAGSQRPCMAGRNLIHFRDHYLKGKGIPSRVEEDYSQVIDVSSTSSVNPPSIVIPINQLDYNHPAAQFLLSRGYSLDFLANNFGVGYCPVLRDPGLHAMSNRIYIPVTSAGVLVGYQGRVDREYDKSDSYAPVKYWNLPGFSKTKFLYNESLALHYGTVVICEGATSAWKVGCNAVATLGKTISAQQFMALAQWAAAGKYCVLYFDSDVKDEDLNPLVVRLESMFPGKFVLARLNYGSGEDPGSRSYQENYDFINWSAERVGIKLPWNA